MYMYLFLSLQKFSLECIKQRKYEQACFISALKIDLQKQK